ncbi:MAG: aspartate carbamoyltransferase, partial [Planctomycetales bacterium]|nr:aspartate carbamoyltransferase [Planctomycetales bacterium]
MDAPAGAATWTRRHLLDLESLSPEELTTLLDTATWLKDASDGCKRKLSYLQGKTIANLFFENSTRTRTSFELAGKRLGADVVNMSVQGSSIKKGETLID